MNKKYLSLLLICILLKTFLITASIYSERIGLGPDEAQYWTWSQQLDIGYYSKPPGIAWQIAAGTALFGNTEFGVRFFSLIIGALLPYIVYALARACSLSSRASFWAAITMAFSPFGVLSSMLAITDVGMVLFWTLALLFTCKGIQQQESPLDENDLTFPSRFYYYIGLMVLFGALFKWPIYIFWLLIIPLLIWKPKFYSKHLFGGIALSLLGLLPSLIWNAKHDFPTFRHVYSTIYVKDTVDVGATMLAKGNFLEFFGAQALLFTPILFILFLISCVFFLMVRKNSNLSLYFCVIATLLPLSLLCLVSFFKKLQGNWGDFVYPSSCVLLAWFCIGKSRKVFFWFLSGLTLSIVMTILLYIYPQPLKHNLGWAGLRGALIEAGYDSKEYFLLGDKYQVTSILSFYAPEQKRAYFLNLHHLRHNQFSYWPGMEEEQVGKEGLFVTVERPHRTDQASRTYVDDYIRLLRPYFDHVTLLGVYPLIYKNDQPIKVAFIFKVSGYNGKLPENVNLY